MPNPSIVIIDSRFSVSRWFSGHERVENLHSNKSTMFSLVFFHGRFQFCEVLLPGPTLKFRMVFVKCESMQSTNIINVNKPGIFLGDLFLSNGFFLTVHSGSFEVKMYFSEGKFE